MPSTTRICKLANELYESERRYLCKPLAQFGNSEAIRKLVMMLQKEKYSGTRAHAARALGSLKNPKYVPVLMKALDDSTSTVRLEAVLALIEIEDSAAIPALERASKRSAPDAPNSQQSDTKMRTLAKSGAQKLAVLEKRRPKLSQTKR